MKAFSALTFIVFSFCCQNYLCYSYQHLPGRFTMRANKGESIICYDENRINFQHASHHKIRQAQHTFDYRMNGEDASTVSTRKFEWAVRSGPPLRILPAEYSGRPLKHDVKISAGAGWGDGHHATTRLCISFLAKHAEPEKSMLDFGTGSGILAITAHRLGCSNIVGIDIDDEALEKAAENVALNDINSSSITFYHVRETQMDFNGVAFRDDPRGVSHQYDLVVANILIGPLMKLAPVLSFAVKADCGRLCLSGLRAEQLPALEAVYARYGVSFEQISKEEQMQWRIGAEGEGEWVQVTARRRLLTPEERRAAAAAWNDAAVS